MLCKLYYNKFSVSVAAFRDIVQCTSTLQIQLPGLVKMKKVKIMTTTQSVENADEMCSLAGSMFVRTSNSRREQPAIMTAREVICSTIQDCFEKIILTIFCHFYAREVHYDG